MRALSESLIATLQGSGPVFSYSSFERTILLRCMERFPDLERPLAAIVNRIVDLHPFAVASYYHPEMMGSWSLKSVIRTIAPELDYGALSGIQEGTQAQISFLEAIHPGTSAERRQAIGRDLRTYCAHDTFAMVRLAHFLMERC